MGGRDRPILADQILCADPMAGGYRSVNVFEGGPQQEELVEWLATISAGPDSARDLDHRIGDGEFLSAEFHHGDYYSK